MSVLKFITLPCTQCQQPFLRRISKGSSLTQPFCSMACYYDYRSDMSARFWERVAVGISNECWLWLGAVSLEGYGVIMTSRLWNVPIKSGRRMQAHRLAYFLHHGTLDNDLLVCHACDVKRCCNYHHLWQGTHADNTHDMINKGRMNIGAHAWQRNNPGLITRGERHPAAKLTNNQAEEIRALYAQGGWSYKRLGAVYTVSADTVWGVVTKQHYFYAGGDLTDGRCLQNL